MIQLVVDRERGKLEARDLSVARLTFAASTAAICAANGGPAPHGSSYPIASGHYKVWRAFEYAPWTIAEGPGRIVLADLSARDIEQLERSEKAEMIADAVKIGKITAAVGGLATWNRTDIAIQGGGNDRRSALHAFQPLTPGLGSIRMHNEEFRKLLTWLFPHLRSDRPAIVTVH